MKGMTQKRLNEMLDNRVDILDAVETLGRLASQGVEIPEACKPRTDAIYRMAIDRLKDEKMYHTARNVAKQAGFEEEAKKLDELAREYAELVI